MNGNIEWVNESIILSFVVVFQTHVHGRRERAYRQESNEDHPGNHTSIFPLSWQQLYEVLALSLR